MSPVAPQGDKVQLLYQWLDRYFHQIHSISGICRDVGVDVLMTLNLHFGKNRMSN